MNRSEFSKNIAQSLVREAWTDTLIQTNLQRRLPLALHHLAAAITADILSETPSQYAPSAKALAHILQHNALFERVFRYCQKRNIWPAPDLLSPAMAPIPAFRQLDIPHLTTTRQLADWLLLPLQRLDYLADLQWRYEEHGETAINHYHYVLKKKKANKIRVIEAPKHQLKTAQRQILRNIAEPLPTHPDAFGFVKTPQLPARRKQVCWGRCSYLL